MSDRNQPESPREAARRAADDELSGRQPDLRREGETDSDGTPGAGGIGQQAGGGVQLPGEAAGGAEPRLGFVADDEDTPTGPMNAADYVESKRKGPLPNDQKRDEQDSE